MNSIPSAFAGALPGADNGKIVSAREAVKLIRPGSTVATRRITAYWRAPMIGTAVSMAITPWSV